MAPEQVAEAEALLRSGTDLDATCAALGVARRTLERAWVAKYGTTPARWVREVAEVVPPPAGPSPVVCFRFPAHADLLKFAQEDGLDGANEWAKNAVQRAWARRMRKS